MATYIGVSEAAQLLGLSVLTVRRYVASGRLRAYRVGDKTIRLDRNDVEAMLVPIN